VAIGVEFRPAMSEGAGEIHQLLAPGRYRLVEHPIEDANWPGAVLPASDERRNAAPVGRQSIAQLIERSRMTRGVRSQCEL